MNLADYQTLAARTMGYRTTVLEQAMARAAAGLEEFLAHAWIAAGPNAVGALSSSSDSASRSARSVPLRSRGALPNPSLPPRR